MTVTEMTAGGLSVGALVFGLIWAAGRRSLKRSKLVIDDLSGHYQKAERLR